MNTRLAMYLRFALACVGLSTAAHADMNIGAGASMSLGDGALDLGCSQLVTAGSTSGSSGAFEGIANVLILPGGSLSPGSSQLMLGGDFSDAGLFTPGTGVVSIVDACGSGTSSVSGATNFYDFVATTAIGKRLVFPANQTQGIAHALTLQGVSGNLLQVASSLAGQQALLNVSAAAAQSVAYVNARDDKASGATIAPGSAANYHSVDAGDLTNWFGSSVTGPGGGAIPVAAPSLGPVGRLALLAGVLWAVWRRRRAMVRLNISRD